MSKLKLKYGKKEKEIYFSGKSPMERLTPLSRPTENFKNIIEKALDNPLASPPLEKIVEPGETVCIIISDLTRSWQKIDCFLPLIIERLNQAGIDDQSISIIIATGTHRSHSIKEKKKLVGSDIYKRCKIIDHDCRDKKQLSYLGRTSLGTPVEVNKTALNADKLILTGGIVFHDLAGWSGGRKSIVPGIASYEAIMKNHSLALAERELGGIKDEVRCANFDNNPVHKDMEEAIDMIKPDFILNVIPGQEKNIGAAVAGHYRKAHRQGCKIVKKRFSVNINKKADLVIASCGGYPKDINLYQASKSLINAARAVRDGGYIILLAECSEGIGNPEVKEILQEYTDNYSREKSLRNNFSISRYSGFLITTTIENKNLILISNINKDILNQTKINLNNNLEKALKNSTNELPDNYYTYIMPEAANTLPIKI